MIQRIERVQRDRAGKLKEKEIRQGERDRLQKKKQTQSLILKREIVQREREEWWNLIPFSVN